MSFSPRWVARIGGERRLKPPAKCAASHAPEFILIKSQRKRRLRHVAREPWLAAAAGRAKPCPKVQTRLRGERPPARRSLAPLVIMVNLLEGHFRNAFPARKQQCSAARQTVAPSRRVACSELPVAPTLARMALLLTACLERAVLVVECLVAPQAAQTAKRLPEARPQTPVATPEPLQGCSGKREARCSAVLLPGAACLAAAWRADRAQQAARRHQPLAARLVVAACSVGWQGLASKDRRRPQALRQPAARPLEGCLEAPAQLRLAQCLAVPLLPPLLVECLAVPPLRLAGCSGVLRQLAGCLAVQLVGCSVKPAADRCSEVEVLPPPPPRPLQALRLRPSEEWRVLPSPLRPGHCSVAAVECLVEAVELWAADKQAAAASSAVASRAASTLPLLQPWEERRPAAWPPRHPPRRQCQSLPPPLLALLLAQRAG